MMLTAARKCKESPLPPSGCFKSSRSQCFESTNQALCFNLGKHEVSFITNKNEKIITKYNKINRAQELSF